MAIALAVALVGTATAAPPSVAFDVPSLVACDDVTTEAFRAARPGEKLIAVRLAFSSLVERGNAAEITDVLYRIEGLDRETFVLDYAPKTTFAALAKGDVAVEHDTDEKLSLNANVKGRYLPLAEGDAAVSKNVNEQTRLRYALPAPQEVVVTAGTWQRAHGVFFKLRASRRGSLEGAKDVVVLYAVPQNWRAGLLRVEAEARSATGGVLGEGESFVCGQASFLAGAYLTGDLLARDAVATSVAAERAWQQAQADRARRNRESFGDQVRGAFDEFAALAVGKKPRDAARQAEAEAALQKAQAARDTAVAALERMNAMPRE